ncbi:type VII secretion target [Williamsia sp. MIQD14]|uniref:type VII secretion target n=1 Tax=Williamsia sp. MIQD14 TaxID=3425703 RepID=UPI003DA154AD
MDEALRIDVGGVVELADELHRAATSLDTAARAVDTPAFDSRSVGSAYVEHAEAYGAGMTALRGEIAAMRSSIERLADGTRTAAAVLASTDTDSGGRIAGSGLP